MYQKKLKMPYAGSFIIKGPWLPDSACGLDFVSFTSEHPETPPANTQHGDQHREREINRVVPRQD